MAASSGSADAGNKDKPTFTFEQVVLRFVVGGMFLALLVMVIEFGQVRGRVHELETGGAPSLAAATQDPLGSPQTFKVVLKEMEVVPKVVEVPAGTPVILKVANQGAVPHNLTMDAGPKTPDLEPGGTATLDLGTVTKTMPGFCSVPGHKDAGMTFEVRVTGTGHAAGTAAQAEAAPDDSAKLDPNATPPAGWQPYDPRLAPAPGGREHKLTLTATETTREVARWRHGRPGPAASRPAGAAG